MSACQFHAPNGEKSILYAALEQRYGPDSATWIWHQTKTDDFPLTDPLDENGEPTLDTIERLLAVDEFTLGAKQATINVYSSSKQYGLLSNFGNKPFRATVQTIDGKSVELNFPTVEHYYQVRKALMFKDADTANKIFKAITPLHAKQLGGEVKGFKQKQWDAAALDILKEGMHLSFDANPAARILLLSTGDNLLTHKSPKNINLGRWEKDFPEALMELRSFYQQQINPSSSGAKITVHRNNDIITRDVVKANPKTLYLFGDNTDRKGLGGQAKEMRGEPNAHGIITKRHPANKPEDFLTDDTLQENKDLITADINAAIAKMKSGQYDTIVISPMGQGLAKLPEKAPQTWEHLQSELNRLEQEVQSSSRPRKTLKGKMTFDYRGNNRPGVQAKSTFEAILNGERRATTRYESDGHLEYWQTAQVGDLIEWIGPNGQTVTVEVTKPLTKLSPSTKAADWSKKEGWSEQYFAKHVKPKLGEAWQIEYKLLEEVQTRQDSNTTEQQEDPNIVRITQDKFDLKTIESFKKSYIQIIEQAIKEPEKTFVILFESIDLLWINDQKLTGSQLANILDHPAVPANMQFTPSMRALMENLPKRFLRQAVMDTPNPLGIAAEAVDRQMEKFFIQVRDAAHKPTGEYFEQEKQDEIVDSIIYKLYNMIEKRLGKPLVLKELREFMYADLNQQRLAFLKISTGTMEAPEGLTRERAGQLAADLQLVLNSFFIQGQKNSFWNMAMNKLESYGIRIKGNEQLELQSQAMEQMQMKANEESLVEEEGIALRDFSDSSFELDLKDTASTRMKLFLLSIVESTMGPEQTPKPMDLFIGKEQTKKDILEGRKAFVVLKVENLDKLGLKNPALTRNMSAPVARNMTMRTVNIDGKIFRMSAVTALTQAHLDRVGKDGRTLAQTIEDQEGITPAEGDVYYRLEPYVPLENQLHEVRNFLGMPKLTNYEQLFEELVGTLSSRRPDLADYVQVMKDSVNPNVRQVAAKFETAAPHIQKEFISVMSAQYQRQKMVMFTRGKDGYVEPRIIDSNRANELETIRRNWQERQKLMPILTKDEQVLTVIDRQLARELYDIWKEITEFKPRANYTREEMEKLDKTMGYKEAQRLKEKRRNQIAEDNKANNQRKRALFEQILEVNGIDMHPEAIEMLFTRKDFTRLTEGTSITGMFVGLSAEGKPQGLVDILVHRLYIASEQTDESTEEYDLHEAYKANNPLYSEGTVIGILARAQKPYEEKLYTQTHRSADGKTIYAYGLNTALSHAVRELKDNPEFRESLKTSVLAADSWLVAQLSNDPQQMDRFNLVYLDGLKNTYGNRDGVTRPDMSDREQWFTALALYQNKGSKKYANYISLTHSDKTNTPVFENAPKLTDVVEVRAGKIRMDRKHLETLFEYVFMPEYKRMTSKGGEQYKGYEQGKKLFYFLPKLNRSEMAYLVSKGTIKQEMYDTVWDADGNIRSIDHPGFKRAILLLIDMQVNQMTDATWQSWQDSQLLEAGLPGAKSYYDRLMVNAGFSYKLNGEEKIYYAEGLVKDSPEGQIELRAKAAALDYTVNSFLFNVNLVQLFYGDPALVFKGSLQATLVEYGKRLAKDIAPGRDGEFSHSPVYLTITAADVKLPAKEVMNINTAYGSTETTDAQEWTTVEEHLDVLYAYGKITKSQWDVGRKIIQQADGGYYTFEGIDGLHELIMQPMKPVGAGLKRPDADGVMRYDYVKTSSFALYPPVTAGMQLDKVRVAMEKSKIARLVFPSGKKIGSPATPVQIFDEEGKVIDGVFDTQLWKVDARQTMDRSEFRIQQEVPYDEDKDSILTVSQMNKLVVDALATITTPFEYRGQQLAGAELRQIKEGLRKSMVTRKQHKFLEKIGATYNTTTNQLTFTDKKKFYRMLSEEAASRDGYTINDVMALTSILENTDELTLPLMFAPNASRFESMMMSLIHQIVKIKIPGKSYIQASPAGFQFMKTWEEMDGSDRSAIVWTSEFEGPLKTAHIDSAGKVQPAQILVGFNYFTDRGERIDIQNFITEVNGKKMLDTYRLPRELFQLIAARIPNQGFSSMLPIEIVGFLPQTMGDMVVVPTALTRQMGADFDVDKLFTYHRAYREENITQDIQVEKTKERLGADPEDWANLKEDTVKLLQQAGVKPNTKGQYSRFNEFLAQAVKARYPDGNVPKHSYTVLETEQQIGQRRLIPIGYKFQDPSAEQTESSLPVPLGYDDQISDTIDEQTEEAHRINEYFDVHWSVLTHPEVFRKVINPLDKDDAKKESKLGESTQVPYYLSPAYQLKDFISMKGAKSLVGMTSLALTSNAQMQDKNISLMTMDPDSHPEDPQLKQYEIVVADADGNPLGLSHLSGYGQSTYGGETRSKSDNIQIQQNESVDHAKNRIIDKLNLTPITAVASLAMSRLQTPDQGTPGTADFVPGTALSFDYNARMLLQPIVQEYALKVSLANDGMSPNYTPNVKEKIAQDLLVSYINQTLQASGYQLQENESPWEAFQALTMETLAGKFIDTLEDGSLYVKLNPQTLLETLQMEEGPEFYMRQYHILETYLKFEEVGRQLTNIQSVSTQDTRGAGKDLLGAITVEEKKNRLGFNPTQEFSIVGVNRLFGNIQDPTELGIIYQSTTQLAQKAYEADLPYNQLQKLYEFFMVQQGRLITDISEELRRTVFRAVKAYISSNKSLGLFADTQNERLRLLFTTSAGPSLAKRIRTAQNSWGQSNYLLQRLETNIDPDGIRPDVLAYSASKASRADDYENTRTWLSMLKSGNPEIKALAEDLVRYIYVTGGSQNAKNFTKYLPWSIIEGTSIAIGIREQFNSLESYIHNTSLYRQIYQHNPQLARQLSEDLAEAGGYETAPDSFLLPAADMDTEHPANALVILNPETKLTEYPQFLSVRQNNSWLLYEKQSVLSTAETLYARIDLLGNSKDGIEEYSASISAPLRSVYAENRAPWFEVIEPAHRELTLKSRKKVDGGTLMEFKDLSYNKQVVMNRMGFVQETGGIEELNTALSIMASDKALPAHVRTLSGIMAEMERNPAEAALIPLIQAPFKKSGEVRENFSFQLYNPDDIQDLGQYNPITNTLMIGAMAASNVQWLGETVLHEMLHYHTSVLTMAYDQKSWEKYDNSTKQLLQSIRNQILLNPELIDKLQKMEEFRERIYKDFKARVIYKMGEDHWNNETVKNEGKYGQVHYALHSLAEFVPGVLTNPDTITYLNTLKFHGEKSLLEQFKELFSQLYGAMMKSLGVNKGTVLEESVKRVLDVTLYRQTIKVNEVTTLAGNQQLYELTSYRKQSSPQIDSIDAVLTKLAEQKQQIIDSFTGVLDPVLRHDKRRKIEALDDQIALLKDKRDLNTVVEIGKQHLKWVETIRNRPEATANEVMMALRLANMWESVQQILFGLKTAGVDLELGQVAVEMKSSINQLIGRAMEIVEADANGFIRPEDWETENLKDATAGSSKVRSLSAAAQSRVIQHLAGYIETVGRHEDEDIQRLMKELNRLENDMKKHAGKSKGALQGLYEKLMQQDTVHPDGTVTQNWGMSLQFTPAWFEWRQDTIIKRNRALKKIDEGPDDELTKRGRRKIVWEKYWKEVRSKATYVDTTIFFDTTTGEFKDNIEAAKAALAKQVGEDYVEEILSHAQERYLRYVEDRNTFFELLDAELAGGEKTAEKVNQEKVDFQNRYSPNVYFDQMNGKKTYRSTSDKYVTFAPLKTSKQFWDAQYLEIMNDPQLKKFYQEYTIIMKRLLSYLPKTVQENVGSGFLPRVSKEVMGEHQNFKDRIRNFAKEQGRSVTASDWQIAQDLKMDNRIPIEYQDNRLSIEERSRDLIGIARVFGMMAIHYKHFSAARDVIEMGESILTEIDRNRQGGAAVIEQGGKMMTTDQGLRNALDAIKYLKEYMVYRKPKKLEYNMALKLYSKDGQFTVNPITQQRRSNEVKKLLKQRETLIDQLENGDIDLEQYTAAVEQIDEQLSRYEGFTFYGSKLGDKLIGINQLKNLSYNPFSAAANISFGLLSLTIHAQGREDFTPAEAWAAWKMMLNATKRSVGLQSKKAEKILNVMDRLGIIGDFVDSTYGQGPKLRGQKAGWKKALEPFAMLRSTDYFMKGMTTLAVLFHQKVKVTEDGVEKEINMFEALNDEGEWDVEKYGERPEYFSENVTEQKEWDRLRNRAVRVNMIIHGNQDKHSPKLINKWILGRLIGQFRMSWLPEGFYSRIGKRKTDEFLGRDVKGRYTTITELGLGGYLLVTSKQLLNLIPGVRLDIAKGAMLSGGVDLGDSELDIANMRRNFAELLWLMTISGSILMIRSLYEDDEEKTAATQLILNMLIRNRQDIAFYASPSTMDAVTRNIIPATQVITDYVKFIKATGRVIIDDDYTYEQWLLKMTKAGLPIPQATLVNKTKYMTNRSLDEFE